MQEPLQASSQVVSHSDASVTTTSLSQRASQRALQLCAMHASHGPSEQLSRVCSQSASHNAVQLSEVLVSTICSQRVVQEELHWV